MPVLLSSCYIFFPSLFFRISLSFFASPQLFIIITVSLLSLGAILIASANACDGSKDGYIFSNRVTNRCASSASSSVALVYLARLASFKKQCIGEIPG